MKRLLLAATLLLATSMAVAACGSDDDGDSGTDGSPTAGATRSPSDADALAARRQETAVAQATAGTATALTPVPANTSAPAATVSPEEATRIAADITGGGPDSTPVIVSTIAVPTPPTGVTPVVDPTEIAPPDVTTSSIEMIVDMDASRAGIQSSRDVNPGDTFRVAIVATNIPPVVNDLGGIAAFNFFLNYDKTKIVAPTIAGGPATERNPDLNLPDLGGEGPQWDCLPAPEGDMDDPGGIDGDGNPATGQAILSCFTFTPYAGLASGTVTLAVVTFTAVASGSSGLTLSQVEIGDALGVSLAHCAGDVNEPYVPCREGTVNVR